MFAPQQFSCKMSFIFTKKGMLKYISHLDLMRLFVRAMRRAELPLKMTQGFSPHPKFSIKRALKLGLESGHEEAVLSLRESMEADEFRKKLQEQLPKGIEVKYVERNFS